MSQTFKDTEGREWTVALTVYAITRVREKTGLDLFAVLDGWPKSAGELSGNPALFAAAVYWLASAAKDAPQATDEDFARAIDGPTLEAMFDAFESAVLDFFRRSPRGPALQKAREKARALQTLLARRALTEAEGLDPERLLAEIERKIADRSKSESTASPGLSVFTPAPSPSAP